MTIIRIVLSIFTTISCVLTMYILMGDLCFKQLFKKKYKIFKILMCTSIILCILCLLMDYLRDKQTFVALIPLGFYSLCLFLSFFKKKSETFYLELNPNDYKITSEVNLFNQTESILLTNDKTITIKTLPPEENKEIILECVQDGNQDNKYYSTNWIYKDISFKKYLNFIFNMIIILMFSFGIMKGVTYPNSYPVPENWKFTIYIVAPFLYCIGSVVSKLIVNPVDSYSKFVSFLGKIFYFVSILFLIYVFILTITYLI